MASRGKGYRPSAAGALAHFRHVRHLLGAAGPLPASTANAAHAPPVLDQGETSSCGGHGSAAAIYTALGCKGTPLLFVPSPKGIYTHARALVLAGTPGAPLTDDGIEPSALLQSIPQTGVRAIRPPTSDGRFSDCEAATINERETLSEDEESHRDLLVGEYALDPRAGDFEINLAGCLAKGIPVGVGIVTTGVFEDWGDAWTAGKAPLSGLGDWQQSDHWVFVLDYRTASDGTRIYRIRNSWGKTWGEGGDIEVTAPWLQSACAEAIAFDVALEAA